MSVGWKGSVLVVTIHIIWHPLTSVGVSSFVIGDGVFSKYGY